MLQNDPNHLATGPSSSMSQMKHMQPHWRSQVRENLRYLRWRKTLHCFLSSFSRLWSRTILLRTGFYLPFAHVHPLASPTPLPEPDSCAHFCRLMRFAHSTHYRGTHGSATLPTHTSTLSAPPQPLQIILMATTACASRIPLIFDGLCPSSISSIPSTPPPLPHGPAIRLRHMAPPYGSAYPSPTTHPCASWARLREAQFGWLRQSFLREAHVPVGSLDLLIDGRALSAGRWLRNAAQRSQFTRSCISSTPLCPTAFLAPPIISYLTKWENVYGETRRNS